MNHVPRAVRSTVAALAIVLGASAFACDETAEPTGARPATAPAPAQTASATPAAAPVEYRCAPPYPTPPLDATTVLCTDPARLQRATLVRVVDGDTIVVEIAGVEERVRFFGVDAPERGAPCFEEASERVDELLADEVLLLPDARDRDRFDRLLRYVYTPDGLSVDAVLVAEGLAEAWRADGDLRHPLVSLEDRARSRAEGCLWSP